MHRYEAQCKGRSIQAKKSRPALHTRPLVGAHHLHRVRTFRPRPAPARQAREPKEPMSAVDPASRRHSPATPTAILPRPLPHPVASTKCRVKQRLHRPRARRGHHRGRNSMSRDGACKTWARRMRRARSPRVERMRSTGDQGWSSWACAQHGAVAQWRTLACSGAG